MIEINGLSKKQVKLLNIMWSLDSIEDLNRLIESLPESDRDECLLLVSLIHLECIDEEINEAPDFSEANAIIKKIQRM